MREIYLGAPTSSLDPWLIQTLREIENASREGVFAIVDNYTVTGTFTPTRTLDADTATTADVIAFIATLIDDLQKRGSKRAE